MAVLDEVVVVVTTCGRASGRRAVAGWRCAARARSAGLELEKKNLEGLNCAGLGWAGLGWAGEGSRAHLQTNWPTCLHLHLHLHIDL